MSKTLFIISAVLVVCVAAAPSGIFSTKDIYGNWQTNITTFPNKAHLELKGTFSDVSTPAGFYLSLWEADYGNQHRLAEASEEEGLATIDVDSVGDTDFQIILRAWHPQTLLNTVDILWSNMYSFKADALGLNPIECKYQAKKISAAANTVTFHAKGKACDVLPLRINLEDNTFGENQMYEDSVLKTDVVEGENIVKLNKVMRPNKRSSMKVTFYVENPRFPGSVQQIDSNSLPVGRN
ncbi:hypothetical protein PROFUN_05642 [Planoprotostelium fungivorum]|uniref:Uncharacterized protein n=1 Tax=Planoprotostelium fungivorum TaxID=1890364 RepID=A0A2P6MUD3_9EUKA|nr:hypothetical protein PROFUN_05642 [Planoprotostelium fungivorum]